MEALCFHMGRFTHGTLVGPFTVIVGGDFLLNLRSIHWQVP